MKTQLCKALAALAGVLLLGFLPGNIPLLAAQDVSNLCYGWYSLDPNNDRVVTGDIDNTNPSHDWSFPGQASTYVTIRLEVVKGDLDPFLYIADKTTGQQILSSSANEQTADGRKLVSVRNLLLNSDGNYTMTVTRLGEVQGTSTGTYRLSLEPGVKNPISSTHLDAVIFDSEVVTGNVSSDQVDAWYFNGERGQLVTVIASNIDSAAANPKDFVSIGGLGALIRSEPNANSEIILKVTGSAWTTLELLEVQGGWYRVKLPDGREGWVSAGFAARIKADDIKAGILLTLMLYDGQAWQTIASAPASLTEARLSNFELPSNGQYAVTIQPTAIDLTYQLTLAGAGGSRPQDLPCQKPPPECPAISPLGTASITLANGVPASGSITAAAPAIAYQFVALESNIISVRMQRTGGDLDTFIGLADERGNILGRDDGFDPASSAINGFPIPADGCYFAFASRAGVGDGTTEGTFIITVSGISAVPGSAIPPIPPGFTPGRDITPGDTARGTIDSDNWQIAYRFQTESGGSFTAIATRSQGNFNPALVLLDAKGIQLDTMTANFVGNASNPLTFTAEAGAYYFVVVRREDGANGSTTGDFSLIITPAE